MREIDINESGDIDYSEFLMCSIPKEKLLSKGNLKSVYDVINQKKNNKLCMKDLQILCGEKISNDVLEELFLECDEHGNGFITFNEFVKIM